MNKANIWIIDSGATSSMTWNRQAFLNYQPIKEDDYVQVANKRQIPSSPLTRPLKFLKMFPSS